MRETTTAHPLEIVRGYRLPPPLCRGDTIGIVAPAGPICEENAFYAGVRTLHELGYQTKFQRDLVSRRVDYLAGTDDERAEDFNTLWADPDVKAIIAARGGYGSLRLLDRIDMDLIRSQPKRLIGFSDITVLHAAILKQTGLITFHGPVISTLKGSDKTTIHSIVDCLSGCENATFKPPKIEILKKGKGSGVLLGGNLTNLIHLLSTPHELSWNNAILFLEDVGEVPYRVDRMLTHLHSASRLQKISGLILGSFCLCPDEECNSRRTNAELIWKRVIELFADRSIPIWGNFPVGHDCSNVILPHGAMATMDSSTATLQLEYPPPC